MTDQDFDCPPEMSEIERLSNICEIYKNAAKVTTNMYNELQDRLDKRYEDARNLIDGCYEIVEIWKAETPSQIEWKQKWLEGAKKHGASSF